MKIIIAGAGDIGRYLAANLSLNIHHDVSVIDRDAEKIRSLDEDPLIETRAILGDTTSYPQLNDADVHECDLFVAVSGDTSDNLVSAKIAKELGAKKTIARISHSSFQDSYLVDFNKLFSLDSLVCPEDLTAKEICNMVRSPGALSVEETRGSKIVLFQVKVAEGSPLAGQQLRQMTIPENTRIASITRGDKQIIAGADSFIKADDILWIVGDRVNLLKLSAQLQGRELKTEELAIVIFGGSDYGVALANRLSREGNHRIKIFEQDSTLAYNLRTNLKEEIEIVNADASVLESLKEEFVGEADYFIACSEDDEDNFMTCMQAKQLGADHCISIVKRSRYARFIDTLSDEIRIESVISPRDAIKHEVEKIVANDRFYTLKEVNNSEVLEVKITEEADICGKIVNQINWPEGCALLAHYDGKKEQVPTYNTKLMAGDKVVAIVPEEEKESFFKLF